MSTRDPEIYMIEPTRLTDSPFQPRRRYDAAALTELANSLKSSGMLQPIVARPITQRQIGADIDADLEIIFGHRRQRAAITAGMDEVPVIIRTMTDSEVRIAQLAENMQREDVTPLEEGEAMKAALADDACSVPKMAQELGVSKAYIYARVKLTELTGKARSLVEDGTISAEVGVLIARLPEAVHDLASARVMVKGLLDDTARCMSLREARTELARSNMLTDLHSAQFSLFDHKLLDGVPDCMSCPNMSTNMPAGASIGQGHLCTIRSCYEAKRLQAVQQEINALESMGWTIDDGRKVPDHYLVYDTSRQKQVQRIVTEYPYLIRICRAMIITEDKVTGPFVFRYLLGVEFSQALALVNHTATEATSTPSSAAQAPGVRGSGDGETPSEESTVQPTVATPRDLSDRAPVDLEPSRNGDALSDLHAQVAMGILRGQGPRVEGELLLIAAAMVRMFSDRPLLAYMGIPPVVSNDQRLDLLRSRSPDELGRIALASAVKGMGIWCGTGAMKSILMELAPRYCPTAQWPGDESQSDDPALTGVEKVFVDAALAGLNEQMVDAGLTAVGQPAEA